MPITVTCQCGQSLQAKEALAGKRVKCPRCSAVLLIPQSQGAAAPAGQPPAGPGRATPAAAPAPQPSAGASPLSTPSGGSPPGAGPMTGGLQTPALGAMQSPLAATATPARQNQAAAPKKKGGRGLLIGLIAGGAGLLLVVVIVVLVIVFSGESDPEVAESDGASTGGASSTRKTSSSDPRSTGGAASNQDVYRRHQKIARQYSLEMRNLISVLDTVNNRESARSAAAEIDRVRERVKELLREAESLPSMGYRDNARLKREVDRELGTLRADLRASTERAARNSQGEPRFASALTRIGNEWRTLGGGF